MVEPDLTILGHPNIFAIGDTAARAGAKGSLLPSVAPVAKQQGIHVADLILGRRTGAFAYRDYGNLATIGRKRAVIDWGRLQLSGFPAWLIYVRAVPRLVTDNPADIDIAQLWARAS